MSESFDIYTVIFLVLAVFIFLRLRSVLGTRTGNERPPYDPYSRREAKPTGATANENVVTLPKRGADPERAAPEPIPAGKRWEGIADPDSGTAHGLDAIAAADPSFDAKGFLQGAKAAYEMIVTAFAQGDRRALKPLLAKDVFDGFSSAISDRESRGETVESTFISIDRADITEAELRGRTAHITVRFASQLVSATRARDGSIVEGSPDKVSEVNDVWTFAREAGSRDPNWKLVATGAE